MHSKESERLKALHSLEVLDTDSEDRFDQIVYLVSLVFEVPIATVSLIDENRQWFKSKCGLDVTETPREVAFCAHAIHEQEILVIPDATKDSRFRDNPLVTNEPYIRFYAGAVIKTPSGLPLGTICIIDTKPRVFNKKKQDQLIGFSKIVSAEMSPNSSFIQARVLSQLASNLDQTTGYYIFREFVDRCDYHLEKNIEGDMTFICCIVEVPNFDNIAEHYGQYKAEIVLARIAKALQEALSEHPCIFGRIDRKSLSFMMPSDELPKLGNYLQQSFANKALISPDKQRPKLWFGISPVNMNITETLNQCRIVLRKMDKSAVLDHKIFDEKNTILLSRSRAIVTNLVNALEENSLVLHYQPKISFKTNRYSSAEALLRWHLPELGYITPIEILQAAHDIHLVKELDLWVLEETCKFLSLIINNGIDPIPIAVNISGETLLDVSLLDHLIEFLDRYKVPPKLLTIEILETSLIEKFDEIIHQLEMIRGVGINFILDDFGTGLSSLRYLQKLPVSELKIDKIFIDRIILDEDDASLVSNIISLSHSLNLRVTAEGVEEPAQYQLLKEFGCDLAQGYLFSKAVSSSDFIELITSKREITV